MITRTTLPSHERPILIRVPRKPDLPPGITRRPSGRYPATVFIGPDRPRTSKTFNLASEARAWKRDTEAGLAHGTVAEHASPTLRKAGAEWLAAAHDGAVRSRSGQRYRPSTLRGYEHALETRLYPALGSTRLSEIRRGTLNRLLGELQAQGLSASTTRNILMPLRAIFRWALDLELITVNPTSGLALPQDSGRRERFATATELTALLAALPERDRALWATAAYAGLRRGELMALRWSEVDLGAGIIHVNRSHNPESGSTGEPKSRPGNRRVPACERTRASRSSSRAPRSPDDAADPTARSATAAPANARAKRGQSAGSGRSLFTSAATPMRR
jgi:integrase